MIILDITIVAPGGEVGKKLGNPQTWTEESAAASTTSAPAPTPRPVAATPKPQMATTPAFNDSLLSTQMTHPITSLSPYQNK